MRSPKGGSRRRVEDETRRQTRAGQLSLAGQLSRAGRSRANVHSDPAASSSSPMEGKPGPLSLRSTLRDSLREVDDSTITLQGFLVKRAVSATLWKNWKRRWLVLRASPCGGGSLAWHVGPDPHGKPNGSLLLLEHSSLEHTNIDMDILRCTPGPGPPACLAQDALLPSFLLRS